MQGMKARHLLGFNFRLLGFKATSINIPRLEHIMLMRTHILKKVSISKLLIRFPSLIWIKGDEHKSNTSYCVI